MREIDGGRKREGGGRWKDRERDGVRETGRKGEEGRTDSFL